MSKREITDSLERPGVLKDVKVVLVGPAKCGKTALVQRFVNDVFCETYVPTGFEKYSTKTKVGDFTVQFSLWDTSGSGSYDTIRPLAYQDANVFMLCFNVADSESLSLAINKWFPEIRSHCPTTPIVLCGCRADARSDYTTTVTNVPATTEQALLACQHINASAYVECTSVYSGPSVYHAFEVTAEAALGLLNVTKKSACKKQKKSGSQSPIAITKTKTPIKSELRGRASKNCCIM